VVVRPLIKRWVEYGIFKANTIAPWASARPNFPEMSIE